MRQEMGGGYTWRGQPSGITSRDRAVGLMEWIQKQAKDRDMTVTELAANQPEVFYDLVKSFDRKWLGAGVPKLRRGEKQGDIFAAQTEDLTLAVETGVDWGERQRQAEIAEQERIKAQLKQDEAQGSLFAAAPQLALPAEKLAQFVSLAQKLVTAGVDTPEKLATELTAIFGAEVGKVRPYSQALWDAIGMVKPELRATHDWTKAYGDTSGESGKVRPRRAPLTDGGFTDHPFIAAIMGDFGGIMSKSVAKQKLGERFEANASLWDGAPKLADPRHTKVYNPRSGQTPDAVAQGLADMGLLRDGDVDELWSTLAQISNSSKSLERQERDQAREQKRLEAEAATQPPEEEPFEDPFAIDEVGDRVRIMQPTLHGPAPATGHIDRILPDGRLEVRLQLGGIVKVWPTDVLPSKEESRTIGDDDAGGRDDLEPDSELAAADEPGSEDSVQAGPGTTRTPGTLLDDPAGGPENAATSGPLSADVPAAPHREQGDLLVPESAPAVPERAAGSLEPEGSSRPRDDGLSADTDRTKIAGEDLVVAPLSQGVGIGSESGGTELEAIQRAAPALTPEQAEDVRFIEARLHEQGKAGVLLTNGTGTGKTFSGMGEVKMMLDRGAKNILAVVPSDKIGSDWVDTAHRFFGVKDAVQLPSTFDNAKDRRMVVTTYANFGQNNTLVKRPWDLVVADESHYLSSSATGETTLALDALRALTWHPQGLHRRVQMLDPEAHDGLRTLRIYEKRFKRLTPEQENQRVKFTARQDAIEKEVRKEMTAKAERERPKVLFMSATPFAYRKSVDYGNGYLFDYPPENTSGAYNTPSPFGQFMIENFGYRMRTGKLTEPENATATGILERRFAERLMREKAMRGRALVVPHDYSRDFVLTESQLGAKVDEIISKMMGSARLRTLEKHIGVTDYLQRRFLLESLKARESLPRIRKHLALGRKVVVFHDYKLGGAMNPLRPPMGGVATYTDETGERRQVGLGQAYMELKSHFPDWDKVAAELTGLRSPISYFTEAFGADELGIFNGGVSKRQRREIVKAFNDPNGKMRVMLAQRASAKEGISLHDIDGTHQRVFIDLGIPGRPTDAIQSEGRIYRHGVKSNAVDEYLVTGTNFERWTFAQTIAQRASTAENLAMGEGARALLLSFSTGFNDAQHFEPHAGQGVGGKQMDEVRERGNPYTNAVALYYTNEKKTSRSKSREGVDYFATPEPIGFKMVEWADVKPGEKVLEPSAGHGAIARFFPDSTTRHAVEPSNELAGRLALNAPDTEIHNQRFEDFNVVNKFNAVIMNPPFGTAGKTAMEHVEKAAKHLKESDRLVALIPSGPSMDKRLNEWLESEDIAGNFHLRASVYLPSVAFERAGTSVSARVVIIDKSELPLSDLGEMTIDLRKVETVKELFDRLEHRAVPGRPEKPAEPEPAPEREPKPATVGGYTPDPEADRQPLSPDDKALTPEALEKLRQERLEKYDIDKLPDPTKDSDFTPADFAHTKTGAQVYVAKTARYMSKDEFAAARARAKQLGGYYSSFKGAGAIPGFHFKTPEARDAFLGGTPNEALGAARPFKAVTAVYKDDVERVAKEIGLTAKEAFRMLQHLVSPTTGVAMQAHDRVMKMLGERNQRAYETDRVLEVARKAFDKMERKDQVAFVDRMKQGKAQATPELQTLAETMRKIDTESWDAAHAAYIALGFKNAEVPLSWLDNHFRVLWKKIPGTDEERSTWIGKAHRGLRGSMGQHKQHTLDTMSEGIEMGGIPYSYNPVEMFKLAQADLWKLTTTLKVWKWAKDAGFVEFVPGPFPKVPNGMTWLDDSIANIYFPAASGEGLVAGGKYAVEAGFGRLLNNYLSIDHIRKTKLGRGLLWIKNFTTSLELSLSPFHAVFETMEMVGSDIGLGLSKLVNRGILKGNLGAAAQGVMDIIKSPASPVTGWHLGREIRKAAGDPEAYFKTAAGKKMLKSYPRAREFIDDLFTAGWKPNELEQDWKNQSVRTFVDSVADIKSGDSNNYIGAGLRAFPAANEMLMRPLFDYYIPSLKVAQFFKEYAEAIEQNERKLKGGILTRAALARQVWEFVEDRFGEMNFDSLFWNRNFKTAMQLMFRSVTWKLGSLHAFAGGFGGQAKEFKAAFEERRAPELHRNMAWLFGMFLLTATLGAIISKVVGRKDPESLTDYVFPQVDPKDDKVRVSLPTYFKDLVHLIHDPKGYVTASMSGWIGRVADLLRNKDYYGVQIRDDDDSVTKQALAVGKYAAQSLLPFSVRGYKQMSAQDVGGLRKAMAFLAMNPAPRHVSQSAAEKKAEEYWKGRSTEAGTTPEQFEAKQDKRQIVQQIRHGHTPDISGALARGTIKPADVKPIYQRAQMGALASQVLHMPLADAEKVYQRATVRERTELAGIMARKRANSAVRGRKMFSGF
jgi:predicted RNA methylase